MLQRSDAYLATRVNNELVMLHITSGEFIGLTETAAEVWHLLERPATIDELCQSLQEEFAVDPVQCRDQVAAFVNDMVERGAIVETSDE